jgi:hypothetical protein
MRPSLARMLTQASQLLMHVAVRLLGARQATWARAMQAELAWVDSEREALAFACGCLRAAIGHALKARCARLAQLDRAGPLACTAAVLLGCVFMHGAGAPGHYLWMNLLSLAFALATFYLLPRQRLRADELLRARLTFAMGALLLVATLGPASAPVSPWLRIGPVSLNLAWLLLPAVLVGSEARAGSPAGRWATGGLLMACGALVLMADALLLGLAAAVLSVRAWQRRSGVLVVLMLPMWAAVVHLALGWQAPAAVAFVDRVVSSGFERNLAAGLALAGLQVVPLWPAIRHCSARPHGLVWGLLVALSLPGWLPSPLVGFGGSFILGYLLSLAVLPGDTPQRRASGPRRAVVRQRPAPPGWPRSGLA